MSTTRSLEDVIVHDIPASRFGPDLQPTLVDMARGLDRLGRAVSGSAEPLIDEDSLRQFLGRHMPAIADAVMAEAKNRPGHRLLHGGGTSINWPELVGRLHQESAARPAPFTPSLEAALSTYGLTLQSSDDEIRRAISERIPNFDPRAIYDRFNALSVPAAGDSTAISPEFSVGAFWNCVWNHFGWWAIVAAVVIGGALLAAFNPVTGVIAWSVFFWLAGPGVVLDTLTVVLNCLLSS
jgi:hypothetical protein